MRVESFFMIGLLVGLALMTIVAPPASGASGNPETADTNPPVGRILFPLPGAWVGSSFVSLGASFTDVDGISISSLSMTIDGMSLGISWGNFVLNAFLSGIPDGPHTAVAQASDTLGNGPTVLTWSFTVDTVPPVVAITTPTGNPLLTDGSMTLAWTGSDADSGIGNYEVRLDGGWPIDVGTATSLAFPDLAPGVHYFQVTAFDRAQVQASRMAIATVPTPAPTNSTTRVTVVVPDQVPAWAIALVVINAVEAAAVVWLALRRRDPSRPDKPVP